MGAFDLNAIVTALPILWDGMQITLMLTVIGTIGGLAFGLSSPS